ncbi:MAG TPA: F0F1 ATP synthase subunit A [Candidatus Angelobacter sp.]|nr:F0F1 ATP synthase subunit A [Candidatus Angelobacter sp.]
MKIFFYYVSFLLFFLIASPPKSNHFNPSKGILDHIKDAHEWHIFGKEMIISLPIILWDRGFRIFLSSVFNHGNKFIEGNHCYYRFFQDRIYKTNYYGYLVFDLYGHPVNENPLDFSVTKNVLTSIISSLILFIFVFFLKKSEKILEFSVSFVRDEIAIPTLGVEKYNSYLPFLLTLFFFIFINNLLGLLPGSSNFTGNISVTLALSSITFFTVNFNSSKTYWKHVLWNEGVPLFVRFILFPIEIAEILIRPITLCIRLFANVTAGHIVLISFIFLIFILKSISIAVFSLAFSLLVSVLEILVAFLQSFIFTVLSSLFIGMTIVEHHQLEE